MKHPTEDELLLFAYGELPEQRATDIESHLAACRACAEQLARLDSGRVALGIALPRRRSSAIVWAAAALAAAAVIGVVFTRSGPSRDPTARWAPMTTWSANAGYVTGGQAMRDIDAQLTRLERRGERYYGRPN